MASEPTPERTRQSRRAAATGTRAAGPTDYADLLESLSGIFWEGDPETLRFRYVSRQAERILGYPRKAWIEEPAFWLEHMHPEDRGWAPAFCQEATAKGQSHEFEYRMLAADGRTVWLRDIVTVTARDGEPPLARGMMIDITRQKRAEDELRRAKERLSRLVENAPIVLFATDRDGVVTHCEGRGLQVLMIEPGELVGRKLAHWDRVTSSILDHVERGLAGEDFTESSTFEDRHYIASYTSMRDARGAVEGVIGVITDVTERVRAEEARERLEAQMRHAQKLESLGVLAGGIAHDFNNLLMTILGGADLALADLGPGQGARAHVERLQRAARSATGLTRQLLAYSGQAESEVRPVNLSSLVSDMVELLKVSMSKNATLELALDPELPAVDADPAQLNQVVINLITNASDALEGRNGSIRVCTGAMDVDRETLSQAHVRGDLGEGRYVFLEVSDSGEGMDAATRTRIFDPFFTTKLPGRGLGLATVLGIVRAQGGTISVYSESGEGTVFRVLLPCSERAPLPAEAPPGEAGAWRGFGRLLIVDDEDDVRELAEEFARRVGFDVLSARDGREALGIVRARDPGIAAVLLDVTMPELSGEEALRELRRLRPELPVVLMSGFAEQYARSRLGEADVAGFLQKPFGPEELYAVLRGLRAAAKPA